ncbi:MAG: hypothetical protein K2X87_13995, partial [Gemmataceae bacterium]|nr:hypothetical protein [Gemmataceae bacterium]
ADPPARRGPRVGVKALLWLAGRQLLVPGLVGSGFALGFGLVLLTQVVQPVLVWPPLALAAGVLAGVTVFVDEQAGGSARFWGERRLPVGRAWAVKVAVHALFAGWLLALLALPALIQAQAADDLVQPETVLSGVFRTRLFDSDHLGGQGWKFLLLPAAYGFAAGHLCGLLFKKAVVATGVAGLVGGTAAALWVPSLLAGGVGHRQLWLPVAAALLTGRLLMRPWAADRAATRRPLVGLAGGVAAAFLVLAVGVGFRAVEVPDDPAGDDDQRYVAGLPPYEFNEGGRRFRSAADAFARAADWATGAARAGDDRPPAAGVVEAQLERVPAEGVARIGPGLNGWLNQVFNPPPNVQPAEGPWPAQAADAVRQPLGLFDHPMLASTTATGLAPMGHARRMGLALVARGLQQQKNARDPAAFVDHLATALALGRNLRNGSGEEALRQGQAVARTALVGADRWLRELDGPPELIRRAVGVVSEDDRTALIRWTADGEVVPPGPVAAGDEVPFDPLPHLLADRYVVRDQQKAPGGWLAEKIAPPGRDKEAYVPIADLVGFGWATPWERERTRRLVGLGPDRRAGLGRLVRGRPGAYQLTRTPNPADLAEQDRQLRAVRRGTLLKLAVRAYQADHGGDPPQDLATLVPGYLPAVPADPYDGAPFRYRVAKAGEAPPPGVRPVQAVQDGQPLVWSVGPNRTDEGGWSEPLAGGDARRDDYVFPVPLPKQP